MLDFGFTTSSAFYHADKAMDFITIFRLVVYLYTYIKTEGERKKSHLLCEEILICRQMNISMLAHRLQKIKNVTSQTT